MIKQRGLKMIPDLRSMLLNLRNLLGRHPYADRRGFKIDRPSYSSSTRSSSCSSYFLVWCSLWSRWCVFWIVRLLVRLLPRLLPQWGESFSLGVSQAVTIGEDIPLHSIRNQRPTFLYSQVLSSMHPAFSPGIPYLDTCQRTFLSWETYWQAAPPGVRRCWPGFEKSVHPPLKEWVLRDTSWRTTMVSYSTSCARICGF